MATINVNWQQPNHDIENLATIYKPLRNERCTRVIELLAGDAPEPLAARLRTIDLTDEPEYEAISYTWGTRTATENYLMLSGRKIAIRTNLWNCLWRLRRSTGTRILWIDALSISQTDLVEKGQQVNMIGDIFGQATCVLVWTGEHADCSEELFRPWPPTIRLRDRLKSFTRPIDVFGSEPWYGDHAVPPKEVSHRRGVWEAFMSRSYWQRTWIVQEILLARSLTIYCGNDAMSWDKMIQSKYRPNRDQIKPIVILDGFGFRKDEELRYSTFLAILFWRDGMVLCRGIKHLYPGMVVMLHCFRSSECEVDLDRAYAFLSFERDLEGEQLIPVDYTIDFSELFIRVLDTRMDTYDGELYEMFVAFQLNRKALMDIEDRLSQRTYQKHYSQLDLATAQDRWHYLHSAFKLYSAFKDARKDYEDAMRRFS